jgi:hypothetical protein
MNARNARDTKSLQALRGRPQIQTWHLSVMAPACRAAGRDYRLPCFAWGYAGEPVRQPVSARRSGRHRFHRSHRTYRTYQPDPVPATTRPLTAPATDSRLPATCPNYRLPATGYLPQLPATGYRLPATGYRLPATGYRLPATGYRLPATGYRLPLPQCGAGSGIFVDGPWPVSIICNLRSQRLMQTPGCPRGHWPFKAGPGGDGECVCLNRIVSTGEELRLRGVLSASRCRRKGACVRIVMATRTIRPGVCRTMLCLTRIQAGGKA